MATADTTAATAAAPWYAAYPAPKSEVVTISREEVLELLKSTPPEKRDFVLVDLRRNDFEVSQPPGPTVLYASLFAWFRCCSSGLLKASTG